MQNVILFIVSPVFMCVNPDIVGKIGTKRPLIGTSLGALAAALLDDCQLDHNAHCISLYWEGDLRNLSYFLNKGK